MRHVDGASLWNLLKALESGGVAVPRPFGDRLVGGSACVAVRRCWQEDVNKLAPLCCGRWGFCQAAPVTAGHIASLGPLFTGALAAILAVRAELKAWPIAREGGLAWAWQPVLTGGPLYQGLQRWHHQVVRTEEREHLL